MVSLSVSIARQSNALISNGRMPLIIRLPCRISKACVRFSPSGCLSNHASLVSDFTTVYSCTFYLWSLNLCYTGEHSESIVEATFFFSPFLCNVASRFTKLGIFLRLRIMERSCSLRSTVSPNLTNETFSICVYSSS